ncbi:hypothetical protein QVD17_20926 [Tagetes erecta]|uniref:Uncharacterized protein n=1 Tax=Tagetes erecta TaxID=13708 RepID=A0AAD8KMF0_TARER|nr:hypothetical protein QVD17_20926 [Tagetes erecta]
MDTPSYWNSLLLESMFVFFFLSITAMDTPSYWIRQLIIKSKPMASSSELGLATPLNILIAFNLYVPSEVMEEYK